MKARVPPPYRLAELRERVIASLGAWTMSTVVPSSSLSLEVWMIRSIIPWEYYVRAEPVPEGLTREARWCLDEVLLLHVLHRQPAEGDAPVEGDETVQQGGRDRDG